MRNLTAYIRRGLEKSEWEVSDKAYEGIKAVQLLWQPSLFYVESEVQAGRNFRVGSGGGSRAVPTGYASGVRDHTWIQDRYHCFQPQLRAWIRAVGLLAQRCSIVQGSLNRAALLCNCAEKPY